MAVNVEVIQDQTTVTVETAGVQGSPGASGTPITKFSATATWRAPRPQNNGASGSNVTGQLYVAQFYLPVQVTLTGIGCHVNAAGVTNAFVNTVLYNDTGNFFPGTLIASTGAIDATTTGWKGASFASVILPAGLYWSGVHFTGTGTMASPQLAQNNLMMWDGVDLGTGATPTYAQGNDGSVYGYTNGVASPPATFAGTVRADSNAPKRVLWTPIKVAG